SFAGIHTQSPSAGANACGSEGGMDNRFDFTLVSPGVLFGNRGVLYLPNTCRAFGNDGVSYNQALNCNNTTSVPPNVCTALRNASDHLPVVLDLAVGNLASSSTAEPATPPAKIFNNPATDQLRVALNGTGLRWSIVGLQGQTIAHGNSQENTLMTIPITDLPPGTYFLLVQNPKGPTFSAAFVKI
ncbi:MAG: T9SS type A sorting domain-containing protein, partial [Saprospiraceae bacterium]|nr:T9SS type A sorting domain-containing protein [Saprospiraceae bacterium]